MNSKSLTIVASAALAAASTLVLSNNAMARPSIFYSTGFEAPTFNNSDAIPSTPPPTLGGWFRQDGTPTATTLPDANITNAVFSTGLQSLKMLCKGPNVNQGESGSVTYTISPIGTLAGANNVVANATPFVHVQWDMRIDDTADIDDTSDTWALDVYDSTTTNRTASVARSAIAAVPGGPVTTAFVYVSGATGAYNPIQVGTGPLSGVWGTYAMDLDFVTHTWTFSLNGSPMGGVNVMNALADNGIDINFTVNGRGLDTGYFDNFSVSAVPEPSTAGVIGLTVGGLLLKRRNRRA